jgi:hypothetical protein
MGLLPTRRPASDEAEYGEMLALSMEHGFHLRDLAVVT